MASTTAVRFVTVDERGDCPGCGSEPTPGNPVYADVEGADGNTYKRLCRSCVDDLPVADAQPEPSVVAFPVP